MTSDQRILPTATLAMYAVDWAKLFDALGQRAASAAILLTLLHFAAQPMGLPVGIDSWFALGAGMAGVCAVSLAWILRLKQTGEEDEALNWILLAASVLAGIVIAFVSMWPIFLFLGDQVSKSFKPRLPVLAGVIIGCLVAAVTSLARRRPGRPTGVDALTIGGALLFAAVTGMLLMLKITASAYRPDRGVLGLAVGAVIAGSIGGVVYRTELGKRDGLGALIVNGLVSLIAAALLWRHVV